MTTFDITARALKDFMDPLLKCAGRDDMLPVLTGIYLRGIDGTLVGMSTDRFRAAFHRHKPETWEGEDFAVLVPATAIKNLLAAFRAVRSVNPMLTVTVDDDHVSVTDHDASMTVKGMVGTFPTLGQLLAQAVADGGSADPAGVNIKFFGDIAAAVPNRAATTVVRTPAKPGKPFLVQPHDDLVFLVMTRRNIGEEGVTMSLGSWIDLLGVSA